MTLSIHNLQSPSIFAVWRGHSYPFTKRDRVVLKVIIVINGRILRKSLRKYSLSSTFLVMFWKWNRAVLESCTFLNKEFLWKSLKNTLHQVHFYKYLQWCNQDTLPKEDPKKYMNHLTHPLSSADTSIPLPEISKFCYIKKYRYRLHFDVYIIPNSFNFFWIFKDSFKKIVKILMVSAKIATLGFLKGILNKDYDVIIYLLDVIIQILLHDSNYIVDVAIWPKFGNCNIHMRKPQFL